MNIEQIRKRVHENPSPFVIRLSDGRRFPISHQDCIAMSRCEQRRTVLAPSSSPSELG